MSARRHSSRERGERIGRIYRLSRFSAFAYHTTISNPGRDYRAFSWGDPPRQDRFSPWAIFKRFSQASAGFPSGRPSLSPKGIHCPRGLRLIAVVLAGTARSCLRTARSVTRRRLPVVLPASPSALSESSFFFLSLLTGGMSRVKRTLYRGLLQR